MDLSLRKLRKNIAAFTVMALLASFMIVGTANAQVATDVYDDVDGTEWYADDVQWGLDNGILDDSQAYFRAGDNATRAEFFKMTAAGAGIPEAACDETLFPDLSADHWGCGWITAMAEAGIVSGDGADAENPGYVRPNDNVLRAEVGKVVVEGYGLTGTSMGSDVFGDVEAGAWYDEYAGTAYDNCVFQGVGDTMNLEPGRNIVRAEAIAVVNRGANPTDTCHDEVVATGALTMSVDGSTPDSSLIPQNASGVSYTVWGLEASNDEDILVEGLTLTRQGLGESEDFDEVRLYVDGVQQGSKKTINNTTNQAAFVMTGEPITVPAGGELLLEARADMDTLNSNSENALCVVAPEDVTAVGADSGDTVDVGGSFAACGEYMYTTSATVGSVEYDASDFGGGTVDVGETDVDMLRLRIEVDDEAGTLHSLTVEQKGSADPEDFANTMWYMDNAPIEGLECQWSGDYFVCDFTGADVTIPDGGVENFDLRTDVVGGIGNTALFDVDEDTDILIIGSEYGYGMNVSDVTATAPTAVDIVGGRVAFSTSADNPTVGDVAPNAEDHEFLGFNIATAGDAVTIEQLELSVSYGGSWVVEDEVEDLKIWMWDDGTESWKIAASSLDPAAACGNPCTLLFEDTISLPASSTTQFMATMDVVSDAPDGAEYSVGINSNDLEAEYTADNDPVDVGSDVSGLPLAGNPQTVAPPNLTIEASTAPSPLNTTEQAVVKNQDEVDLVGYDLTASTASDIVLRTMEISCTATGNCDDYFTNLEMYHKDGGSLFFLDDSNFTSEVAVFNNLNLDILAGQTEKVLVRADITSSPSSGNTAYFELLDGDVAADDEFGYALDADQLDICLDGGVDDCLRAENEGPQLLFQANGAIEFAIEDTLSDDIILDGTNDLLVAETTVTETTEAEDVLLRELRLTNNVDAAGCGSTGVATVSIPYPDPENPYTAALQVSDIAEFSFDTTGDRRVVIPKGQTITIPVYVDTNEISTSGTDSGECINMQIFDLEGSDYDTDIDVEAVGASSGTLLEGLDTGPDTDFINGSSGYTADVYDVGTADVFTIRNNIPTITTNFELSNGSDLYGSGKNPSSTQPVLGFNVSVEGSNTMRMYDIAIGEDGCGATLPYYLYREADWLNNDPALVDSAGDAIFDDTDFDTGDGINIIAGNSVDYVLVTDMDTNCGYDVGDTSEHYITDFSWDDDKEDTLPIPDDGITNDTINSDTGIIYAP